MTPTDTRTTATGARPSLAEGLVLFAGYLAIVFAMWIVTGADYLHIGETVESTRLHYALPTLFGSLFLAAALTVKGWWRAVLFDTSSSGPAWAWIGPLAMFVLGTVSFAGMHPGNASPGLLFWSVLGGIGVGFGEEMITRGSLLVGLRARFTEETAWLYSTLAFSAMHAPNVFFGAPAAAMPVQLVFTFIMGSLLWATRRLSGTLLVPMLLHGYWDSSVFLPRATGAQGSLWQMLIYPIALVCVIAVVRRNKGLRLG